MKRPLAMWLLLTAACGIERVVATPCSVENCTGCCSPSGVCLDGLTSVACGKGGATCTACAADARCQQGDCVHQAMSDAGEVLVGDSCAAPLSFGSGPAEYSVSFLGLTKQSTQACGASWPDAVLALDLPSAGRLVVELTPSVLTQAVAASVTGACDSTQPVRCGEAPEGARLVFVSDPVTSGRQWLWVSASKSAPVGLTVTLVDAADGESCANPLELRLSRGEGVIALPNGVTGISSRCAPAGVTGTQALALTSLETDRLALSVMGANHPGALEVLSGGCGGAQLGCSVSNGAPGSVDLGFRVAGRLSALVASNEPSTLRWNFHAPDKGESCFDRIDLGLVDPSTPAIVQSSLRLAFDDVAPTCATLGTPDRLFEFHTDQTMTVRLRARSSTGQPLAVALSEGTCGEPWLRCAPIGDLQVPYLPRGRYFIAVEGHDDFELSVANDPPSAGESCTSPRFVILPLDGGTVVLQGDTSSRLNDQTMACGADGPDEVFAASLSTPKNIHAEVRGLDGGAFTLGFGSGTCAPVTCALPGDAGQTGAGLINAAGTTYVWVDGASGPYELSLRAQDDEPGATPTNPLVLSLDGGLLDVTYDLSADQHVFGDRLSQCSTGAEAWLSIPAGTVPAIFEFDLLDEGRSIGSFVRADPNTGAWTCAPGPFRLTHVSPAATSLTVDGVPALGHPKLRVKARVATGEVCQVAEPLATSLDVDGGWSVSATGTLVGTQTDVNCTCQRSPDYVYVLQPRRPNVPIRVVVQPQTPFLPMVAALSGCDTSGTGACTGIGQTCTKYPAGTPATLDLVTSATADTYIVVSGLASTGAQPGSYTLQVSTR